MSRSTSCADAVTLGSAHACSHQYPTSVSGVRNFQPILSRPQGAQATHGATRSSGVLSSCAQRVALPCQVRCSPEDQVNGCPLARRLSGAKLTLCASCKGRRFAISATRRACNFRNNACFTACFAEGTLKGIRWQEKCENRCTDEYTVLVFLAGQQLSIVRARRLTGWVLHAVCRSQVRHIP
jgi:hypothetical protein